MGGAWRRRPPHDRPLPQRPWRPARVSRQGGGRALSEGVRDSGGGARRQELLPFHGTCRRERIEGAAARWFEAGRDTSLLLPRGRPLAEAQEALAARRSDMAPDLVAFVEAS